MTDRYAVFGNPVEHSKSPQIHTLFAQQTGQDLAYAKQCVAVDQFEQAARAFFFAGGKGLNITVPFKLAAYEFADQLSKRARQAGAVNTLLIDERGIIHGDNTDGVGLVNDLRDNLCWLLADKRILILGAGGAVRGVLGPLLAEGPKEICIANRTVKKAQQLATAFAGLGTVKACGFEALRGNSYDLLINGTSASLSAELPPLPAGVCSANSCCYDMMYAAKPTVFMHWASDNGVTQIADGLGMLIEQASEAFYLWRGVRPQTQAVLQILRDELSAEL